MAVKIISNKDGEDAGKLTLEIDNGDLAKLNKVISTWGFRDYQSFLRFAVSIMLITEDKFLAIQADGEKKSIKPAADYLKEQGIFNDKNI